MGFRGKAAAAGGLAFVTRLLSAFLFFQLHMWIVGTGDPPDSASESVAIASTLAMMVGWLITVPITSLFATKAFELDSRIAWPISPVAAPIGFLLVSMLAFANGCNTETSFPFEHYGPRC